MLKLNELFVKYNSNVIINNINYIFEEGNIYVLYGENGSGKSTLLKSITGLIKFDGKIEKNCVVGYLPDKQSFPLLLKSYDYLSSIAKLNNNMYNLNSIIKRFKLENKIISSLSKGNLQKIGIIQLLLNDPDVLLLDEPFDGLDIESKGVLKSILLEKKDNNKTIIISLHDKKLFSNKDTINLEVKGGSIYEKKDKKLRTI